MPAGVAVEVEDGYATVEFLDRRLRGVGIGALLAAGGPEAVEKLTRPRTAYRVPESVARAAGLLDEPADFDRGGDLPPAAKAVTPKAEKVVGPPSRGYDDGLPDSDWSRAALDNYAAHELGLDTTGMRTKADVLAAIRAQQPPKNS
jgi:hypothetical protein